MKLNCTIKLLFLFLLGNFGFTDINAQANSSGTINSAGGVYTSDKLMVDWSIGELSRIDTKLSQNSALLVTQGILQPELGQQVVFVSDPSFAPGEVQILPNPVKSILQLQLSLRQIGYVRCMLFSESGQRLFQTGFTYYGYGYTQSINMTKLSTGNYFLYVELEPTAGPVVRKSSFKILKID